MEEDDFTIVSFRRAGSEIVMLDQDQDHCNVAAASFRFLTAGPFELILDIQKYLHPIDILNTSLTSKGIWELWMGGLRDKFLTDPILRTPKYQLDFMMEGLNEEGLNIASYESDTMTPLLRQYLPPSDTGLGRVQSLYLKGDDSRNAWNSVLEIAQTSFDLWTGVTFGAQEPTSIPFTNKSSHVGGSNLQGNAILNTPYLLPFHTLISLVPSLRKLILFNKDIELNETEGDHICKWAPSLQVLHIDVKVISTVALKNILESMPELKDLEVRGILYKHPTRDQMNIQAGIETPNQSVLIGGAIYTHLNLERFSMSFYGSNTLEGALTSELMLTMAIRSRQNPSQTSLCCLELYGIDFNDVHYITYLMSPASAKLSRLHIQPFRPYFSDDNKKKWVEACANEHTTPSFFNTWKRKEEEIMTNAGMTSTSNESNDEETSAISTATLNPLHLFLHSRSCHADFLKLVGPNVSIVTIADYQDSTFIELLGQGCLSNVNTVYSDNIYLKTQLIEKRNVKNQLIEKRNFKNQLVEKMDFECEKKIFDEEYHSSFEKEEIQNVRRRATARSSF